MTRAWTAGATGALLGWALLCAAGDATAAGQASRPVFDLRSLPGINGTDDYVCRSTWELPSSDNAGGRFGAIYVEFFNEPDCQGGFVGSARFFSEGATSGFFDARYVVTETMLQTLSLLLQRAAGTGQRVNWTACDQNNFSCLRELTVVGVDRVR